MLMLAAAQPAVDHLRPAVPDCVVLLHGLGRGPGSMRKLERRLDEAGYVTWNEGYPSRSAPIEALAEQYVGIALADCRAGGATRIHFVTHSLGGILVRQYLHTHTVPEVGRVIMLSPPNAGSEVAETPLAREFHRYAQDEMRHGGRPLQQRMGDLPLEQVR